MSFTDENLKRLKDGLNGNPSAVQDFEAGWLASLIARLEAAEKVASEAAFCLVEQFFSDELSDYLKAWRKEAGK